LLARVLSAAVNGIEAFPVGKGVPHNRILLSCSVMARQVRRQQSSPALWRAGPLLHRLAIRVKFIVLSCAQPPRDPELPFEPPSSSNLHLRASA